MSLISWATKLTAQLRNWLCSRRLKCGDDDRRETKKYTEGLSDSVLVGGGCRVEECIGQGDLKIEENMSEGWLRVEESMWEDDLEKNDVGRWLRLEEYMWNRGEYI